MTDTTDVILLHAVLAAMVGAHLVRAWWTAREQRRRDAVFEDFQKRGMWRGRSMMPTARPYRVECSWCGDVMSDGREPVSHGCCDACFAEQVAEIEGGAK